MILLAAVLSACGGRPPVVDGTPAPAFTPSPTPSFPIDDRIRASFQETNPDLRRENVLRVTAAFLRSAPIVQLSEEEASEHFTSVAFSSQRMTFPDPAVIRRSGDLVVIAIPDGLGIYLYDLSNGDEDTPPLLLSGYSVGLLGMEVIWGRDEFGVSYATLGNDGMTRVHFVLATRTDSVWDVAWFSDEAPDWWFNVYDASLSVSSDLSELVVIGKGLHTTEAFYEDTNDDLTPIREFRVSWIRDGSGYVMTPALNTFPSREAWLWATAEPSDYATLVEFIERMQLDDMEGILRLLGDPTIINDAEDFGLYLPDRQYQIAAYSEGLIFFRDRRGAFIASFSTAGGFWVIDSLNPLGVEIGPTPTPTPLTP